MGSRAKVISIYNQKGGVAKSTTSVNTAEIFAEMGKNVLLIDFDAQGTATLMCNLPTWDSSIPNMGDLIMPFAENGIRASIDEILTCVTRGTYTKNVRVPGKMGWEEKEIEYPFDIIPVCCETLSMGEMAIFDSENFIYQHVEYSFYMLKLIIDTIVEECNYDYIIIDTNPSLSAFAVNCLVASDYLIVPTTMSPEAVNGIQAIFKRLEELALEYPYFHPLGIVYQKFDGKRTLDRDIINNTIFEEFETTIPDVNSKVSKSINENLIPAMRQEARYKSFRDAYISLCKEIEEKIEKYESENGEIIRKKID